MLEPGIFDSHGEEKKSENNFSCKMIRKKN